jgi:hypothetical protein
LVEKGVRGVSQAFPDDDLLHFIASASREMEGEYKRLHGHAGGRGGPQGEQNWASLLRDWLPAHYHVVTNGHIVDQEGKVGPEADVLVLSPWYPKRLIDKRPYLAGGVEAAFECKLTLRGTDIEEAVKKASEIHSLVPKRDGTPYKELHSPIVYGLLAHSSMWTGKGRRTEGELLDYVLDLILEAYTDHAHHPREMLDLVCVADLGTWSVRKSFWESMSSAGSLADVRMTYFRQPSEAETDEWYADVDPKYFRSGRSPVPMEPIGLMLVYLLTRLGWENHDARRMATHFKNSLSGGGLGKQLSWPASDVFSEEVRKQVQGGRWSKGISGIAWDEWSIWFP